MTVPKAFFYNIEIFDSYDLKIFYQILKYKTVKYEDFLNLKKEKVKKSIEKLETSNIVTVRGNLIILNNVNCVEVDSRILNLSLREVTVFLYLNYLKNIGLEISKSSLCRRLGITNTGLEIVLFFLKIKGFIHFPGNESNFNKIQIIKRGELLNGI